MGDSFPPSFRYYDLRIRYPNEPTGRAGIVQDLGRAFGYNKKTEAPVILVGQGCIRALAAKRNRPAGIVGIDPDGSGKMKCLGRKDSSKYPTDEFDLTAYREHWQAGRQSVDWHGHPENPDRCTDWCSPQHFLLFGRPQIGKTGAFLHLVFLLHRHIRGEMIDVEGLDMTEPDDSNEGDGGENNMAAWPIYSAMEPLRFDDSAGAGKYGDPKDDDVWDWYVTDARKDKHPTAHENSTAGKKREKKLLALLRQKRKKLASQRRNWKLPRSRLRSGRRRPTWYSEACWRRF
jgi:hypothetical protein